MRHRARSAFLVLTCGALACAHGATQPPPTGGDKPEILISSELGTSAGAAGWLAYGITRAALIAERTGHFHNQSADDYAIELGAREALVGFWKQEAQKQHAQDAYLDTLVEVKAAGFLEEYVLWFLAKPGWTVPADALAAIDLRAFSPWGERKLGAHQAKTLAQVKPAHGQLWPAIPGDDLPDTSELSPKQVPCAQSMPRLAAASARWSKEEAGLDGLPLAARNRDQFLRAVTWAREQPDYRGRGLTWVSPAVAEVSFLLGFCAVEAHDLATAESALRRAVRVQPLAPELRLELAYVLIASHRFDAALAEIDGVIASSDDHCALARAWRKRGFILVEQGHLEEAYAAYQKSLAYEPASPIALKEMLFIAEQAKHLGGPQARAFKEWKPPQPMAGSKTSITECRD